MAVPNQVEDVVSEAGDSAFLEHSYLTYTVPFGTGVDIEELIKDVVANKQSLEDIEARPWLFFGKDPCVLLPPEVPRLTILIHRCQMKPSTSS